MNGSATDLVVQLPAPVQDSHELTRAPYTDLQTQDGMPHPHINTAYHLSSPLSAAQMARLPTELSQGSQIQQPLLIASASVPRSLSPTHTPTPNTTQRYSGMTMFPPDQQNLLGRRSSVERGQSHSGPSIAQRLASPIDQREERPVACGSNSGAAFERSRVNGAGQQPGVAHAPTLLKEQSASTPQHTRQSVAETMRGYSEHAANASMRQSQPEPQPYMRRQQAPPPPPLPQQAGPSRLPMVPSQRPEDANGRAHTQTPLLGHLNAPPTNGIHPLQARPPPLLPSMHPPQAPPLPPIQPMYPIQAPNGATFYVTAKEFARLGFNPGPAHPSMPVPEPQRRSSLESSTATAKPPVRPTSTGSTQTLYRMRDPKSRGDYEKTLGFVFRDATQIHAMSPLEQARYLVSESTFWQRWREECPQKDRQSRYREAEARIGPLRQWLDQLGPELERDGHQLQLLSGPPKGTPPQSSGRKSSSALAAASGQSSGQAVPPPQQDRPLPGVSVRRFSYPTSLQAGGVINAAPPPAVSGDAKMQPPTRANADGAVEPRGSHTATPTLPRASGPDDARMSSLVRNPPEIPVSTPGPMPLALPSFPRNGLQPSAANINNFAAALGMACRQDLAVLNVSLAAPSASSSSHTSSISAPPKSRKRKRSEADAAPAPAPPKSQGNPLRPTPGMATATTVDQDVAMLLSALSRASVTELLDRSVLSVDGGESAEDALPELTEGEVASLHAFLDACLRVPPGGGGDRMEESTPVLALPECMVSLVDESSVGTDEAFAAAVFKHRQRARLCAAVETWKERNGELITEAALGRVRTHLRIILGHNGSFSQNDPSGAAFETMLDNADGRLPDPLPSRRHASSFASALPPTRPHAKVQKTSPNGSPHTSGTDTDEMVVDIQSTRSMSTGTAAGTPELTDSDHNAPSTAQFDALTKELDLEPPDPYSLLCTFGDLGSMLDGMILQFKGLVDRMDIDVKSSEDAAR